MVAPHLKERDLLRAEAFPEWRPRLLYLDAVKLGV